jgi:non-ribosomal peptide synthetase component F
VHAQVDEQLYKKIRKYTGDKGTTTFAFLLGVFNVLLSRATGSENVVVGTPVAGRRSTGMDEVWGPFINMLPIANEPLGDITFDTFLESVHTNLLGDFDYQEFSMDRMVQLLRISPEPGRNPLFDAIVEMDYASDSLFSIPGLEMEPFAIPRIISKFDLSLYGKDRKGVLHLELNYADELFSDETVQLFMGYLLEIMEQVLLDPGMLLADINLVKTETTL